MVIFKGLVNFVFNEFLYLVIQLCVSWGVSNGQKMLKCMKKYQVYFFEDYE